MVDRPAPLSFGSIPRPAFGRAAQHLPQEPTPQRVTTKAEARYARAATLAADFLPELPAVGTAVHGVMLGTFDLCQLITVAAKHAPEVKHLRIATLCYSKRNVKELCSLLETRKCALTLLVSVFFVANNKDGHEASRADLTAFPNVKIGATRNHCKVVTFDFGNDPPLVFEGSANLRANKNREQLAMIRDRTLHDFHAQWIEEQVSRSNDKEEAREG